MLAIHIPRCTRPLSFEVSHRNSHVSVFLLLMRLHRVWRQNGIIVISTIELVQLATFSFVCQVWVLFYFWISLFFGGE
jgi:hypothetical protein